MLMFGETFSIVKEILPPLTVGGIALSAAGMIPRIGPGRAVWIALRSRFAFKPVPESLRLSEINLLKRQITDKDFGQSYLVVTGARGVGKSRLLNTVTSKTAGVIKVKFQPGEDEKTIIKDTLQSLTGLEYNIPPFYSAKRVVFWYRLFTFGRSPIIVINAAERKVGQKYAGLTGAVRTLVDDYKLRVVVYATPNTLDETLLQTMRELIIDIKPMPKEMIWQIEQLQDLFKYVKEAELDDIVFAVFGGIPSSYEKLWRDAETDLKNCKPPREVIGAHLCAEILDAFMLVKESCGNDYPAIEKLMKLFQESRVFEMSTLVANKLQLSGPEKIFREVEQNGVSVLIPASNAIGIVLKHSLFKEPKLNELEELLKSKV